MQRTITIPITNSARKSDYHYFNEQETFLRVEPFSSNIEGLRLCLKGIVDCQKKPMSDTQVPIGEIYITPFSKFWFEYEYADTDYKITVELY